jgi:hypothetical protein
MRPWRYPPADGFTVHHITDTHIEQASRNTNRVEAIRTDMRTLPASLTHNQVTVHTGDVYHNMYSTDAYAQQRPLAKKFLADLDDTPVVYAVGNHELWNHRSGTETAQYFGYPSRNYVREYGPLRFIVYSAENNNEDGSGDGGGIVGDWVVPPDVMSWIEQQIDSTPDGMAAALVSHCPPAEQFGYRKGFSLEPQAWVTAMLAKPKLVAWFTGHLHHWPSDPNCFKQVTGTALIHGLSCGGALPQSQRSLHPVEGVYTNASVYATYFAPGSAGGHRWECRVRDHDTRTWGTQATGYRHLWTIPLPDPPVATVTGSALLAATGGAEAYGDVDSPLSLTLAARSGARVLTYPIDSIRQIGGVPVGHLMAPGVC